MKPNLHDLPLILYPPTDQHFEEMMADIGNPRSRRPSSNAGSLVSFTAHSVGSSVGAWPPDFNAFFSGTPIDPATPENPTGVTHGPISIPDNSELDKSPAELAVMMYQFAALIEDKEFRKIPFDDIHSGEGIARSIIKLMLVNKNFGRTYKPLLLDTQTDPVFKKASLSYTENLIINLALHYRKQKKELAAEIDSDQFMNLDPEDTTQGKLLADFKQRISLLSQSHPNFFLNTASLPEPELRKIAFDAVVESHSGASQNPQGSRTLRTSFKSCIGNKPEKMTLSDVHSFLVRLAGNQKVVKLELDFSDNELSDADMCELIKTIKQNKLNVTSLHLNNNQIRDETAKAVASLITDGQIEDLALKGDQSKDGLQRLGIGTSGLEALFSAMHGSRLEKLDLESSFAVNYLDEGEEGATSNAKIMRLFANAIHHCKSLTHLNLANNAIDSEGFYFLGKGMRGIFLEEEEDFEPDIEKELAQELNEKPLDNTDSNNLQYLNISNNIRTYPDGNELDVNQQYQDFSSFIVGLERCKQLQVLDISGLEILDSVSAADVVGSLVYRKKSPISTLKMQEWSLPAEGMQRLFSSYIKISPLKTLIIGAISMEDDEDGDVLSECIADLLGDPGCGLEKLSVNYCQIDDKKMMHIVEKISSNSNSVLTHLDLASPATHGYINELRNTISDTGAMAIADMIKQEKSRLIHLNLDGNKVTSEGVKKLQSIMEPSSSDSEKEPVPKLKFVSAK